MSLLDLKDNIVRKIATSLLLKYVDGYKTQIARAFQGVNMLIAGAFLISPVVDQFAGTHLSDSLSVINDKYLLLLQFLGHLGIELGLQDKAAKERLK